MIPSIWAQDTFVARAGDEVLGQMYAFEDKRGRPICLIPEATGIIQELWAGSWSKNRARPFKVFYVARCYRYERPQNILTGFEDEHDHLVGCFLDIVETGDGLALRTPIRHPRRRAWR